VHAFQDAVLVLASALAITGVGAVVASNFRKRRPRPQEPSVSELIQILLPATALLLLLVAVWKGTH
jgi:hypothetical protein